MSQTAVVVEPSPFHPKPTYPALCEIIASAADAVGKFPYEKANAFAKLKDQLFRSPRLVQWNSGIDSVGTRTFSLLTQDEMLGVYVTEKRVWLGGHVEIGPRDGSQTIADGLPAATLVKSISEAQAIIQPTVPKEDNDTVWGEEFFAPDPLATHADIDSALADPAADEDLFPKRRPDRDTEDDEELIAEISEHDSEATAEDWREIEKVEMADTQAKTYVGKINKSSASDTYQVKQEYKDKDPVADCPKLEVTRVIAHLKSLQGNILNIVEASFADQEQRKAVKTLINKAFRGKMNNLGSGWSKTDED